MRFKNSKEINHYLVAEMYHQILLRISPSLLPKVTTRHFVGGDSTPFKTGIDRLDNVIVVDESLLYDINTEDTYKKWHQAYRVIYKKSDIVVYHDLETNYFIISPRVSKLTLLSLIFYNRDKKHQIPLNTYRKIANSFYFNLVRALHKIGEVYIRDMAIADIEPYITTDEEFTKVTNNPSTSYSELIAIFQTITSLNNLVHIDESEGRFVKQLWRPEKILSQKSLSVVYNTLVKQKFFVAFTDNGLLLDPIIRIDLGPADAEFDKDDVGCIAIKYKTLMWPFHNIYALSYRWANLFDNHNDKPYVTEFNLIDDLINLTVTNMISIESIEMNIDDHKDFVDAQTKIYINNLKNDNMSLVKERAIFRMANYEVDDMPNLYNIKRFVGPITKKGKWVE